MISNVYVLPLTGLDAKDFSPDIFFFIIIFFFAIFFIIVREVQGLTWMYRVVIVDEQYLGGLYESAPGVKSKPSGARRLFSPQAIPVHMLNVLFDNKGSLKKTTKKLTFHFQKLQMKARLLH